MLIYTATGLPDGLAIDSSAGLISGQLTGNAIGQYIITVTVTDLQGATVPHRFTIKVMSPTNLGDAEKTPLLIRL